jgi:hypothetical protein
MSSTRCMTRDPALSTEGRGTANQRGTSSRISIAVSARSSRRALRPPPPFLLLLPPHRVRHRHVEPVAGRHRGGGPLQPGVQQGDGGPPVAGRDGDRHDRVDAQREEAHAVHVAPERGVGETLDASGVQDGVLGDGEGHVVGWGGGTGSGSGSACLFWLAPAAPAPPTQRGIAPRLPFVTPPPPLSLPSLLLPLSYPAAAPPAPPAARPPWKRAAWPLCRLQADPAPGRMGRALRPAWPRKGGGGAGGRWRGGRGCAPTTGRALEVGRARGACVDWARDTARGE